jgi:rubrerythrin
MRGSLLHPISAERRRARRIRGEHRSAAQAQEPSVAPPRPDVAAQRVRESGGPTDLACYACQCGYVFAAPVSTTVECPNCGTPQAW